MNAHNERFNRTSKNNSSITMKSCFFTDLQEFNKKLAKWLIDYNTLIPHYSLNLKSPVQYFLKIIMSAIYIGLIQEIPILSLLC
ncbi:integrase core domain-containing protein [Nitratiruptor sp. YY09-18]|uniref:integrase core domain-containing protein n=1 Tax=Nitratiruptor sp. YY09-18 TaxID=2724901 RepID=UPI0019166281|nr:integrase core domain-containing protein [Nitratiruptor sp. YY09-18]